MPTISKLVAIGHNYPIGKYFIQTVLIPDSYTKKEAIDWLTTHGLRHNYHRMTKHFHRFMQHNPVERAKYYTEHLSNGINLVYQKFK